MEVVLSGFFVLNPSVLISVKQRKITTQMTSFQKTHCSTLVKHVDKPQLQKTNKHKLHQGQSFPFKETVYLKTLS